MNNEQPVTEREATQNNDAEHEELSPSKQNKAGADGDNKAPKLIRKTTSAHLEAELKAGGFFGKNCYWITCSLIAGLTMGTGSALYATHYADLGF